MPKTTMRREPGLSVRLKLTLSYAGFLMLAGIVLIVAGYFSLSRGAHPARDHADAARSRAARSAARHRGADRPPANGEHARDRPHRSAPPAQSRRPAIVHAGGGRLVARRRTGGGDAPSPRGSPRRE